MTTYPGDPDATVLLNDSGIDGSFIIKDNLSGLELMQIDTSGALAGHVQLLGDLNFKATATTKTVASVGGPLSLLIESATLPSPLDLRIRSRSSTGAANTITLDGATRVEGGTFTIDADPTSPTPKPLTVLDAGRITVTNTQPALVLEDAASPTTWSVVGEGGALVFRLDEGFGPADVLTMERAVAGSAATTTARGPVGSAGTTENLVIFGGDNLLLQSARGAVVLQPTAGDAGLNLFNDPDPEAFLYAGDATAGRFGPVTLGFVAGGSFRVGDFSGLPSGGLPPLFNDRLTLTWRGVLRIFAPPSTGSPGTNPALEFDPFTTTSEAILSVGSAAAGQRGQVEARWDGSSRPGLFMLEANDGTPVYLSVWAATFPRTGHDLTASLSVPTGPGAFVANIP